MSHNYVVKLILLGDPGTGKTSLLHQFIDSTFVEKHETTIGVDFQAKTVFSSSGNLLRLHLWDTAGQEHFRSIVSAYYRCIAAALLVFDVTNRESFENLDHWLTELREKNSSLKELPIIILGNKTDEEDTSEEGDDTTESSTEDEGNEKTETQDKNESEGDNKKE